MQIGDTVQRHDPGGHKTVFDIHSERDVKYHLDLQAKGYKYDIL